MYYRKTAGSGDFTTLAIVFVLCAAASGIAVRAASVRLHPVKDGTLLDGGINYPFDGNADEADWYFDDPPSTYEGAITLSTAATQLEHRLVWEYDLATVTFTAPVVAELSFFIRGAPALPRPDVDVHVYSYPADLIESLADFCSGPAVFQDHVVVAPFQPSTQVIMDVSEVVSQALANGAIGVAFRFQVHPATSQRINQAFVDARETDLDTKPVLTIIDELPADADASGVVDLGDLRWVAFCLSGPRSPAPPNLECGPLHLNFNDTPNDIDIDLRDLAAFQRVFGSAR